MNTLLLIDGNGLLHRSFHALPPFRTKEGIPTNAVYGFATMLFKTIADFKPTHIAVCFDTPTPTFRKKIFPEYQIHRPKMKDELKAQFPLVKDLLTSAHLRHFEKEGYEADDLIGTIAQQARSNETRVLILTGDRDLIQLVNNSVLIISPQKGLSQIKLYDVEETKNKFGVAPSQIPDFKALAGDASDNYKGVPGVGPKTAVELIKQFGSVENLYTHIEEVNNQSLKTTLLTHKKNALLSKQLATIIKEVPVDFALGQCRLRNFPEELRDFFLKLEFYSLVKRFFPTGQSQSSLKKQPYDKQQLGLF